MSGRRRYAFNDVCFFENAQEHMERDDFPWIQIGTIGKIDGWYLRMKRNIIDNETYYYPFIGTYESKPKVSCRFYTNILKNDESSVYPKEERTNLDNNEGFVGKKISVDELLNEDNGYLKNGGIMIEYGIQIEGVLFPGEFGHSISMIKCSIVRKNRI